MTDTMRAVVLDAPGVAVVIRCTAKVMKLLGVRPSSLAEIKPDDDDWYVNLLWFDGRKCLLLMHAGTTFSVFVPDVRKRCRWTITRGSWGGSTGSSYSVRPGL